MILASHSPRRRELLEEAGFKLRIIDADVDESRLPDEPPEGLVERLACLKAESARELISGQFQQQAAYHDGRETQDEPVVAADTIVWTDEGEVLGKPKDEADAVRMLQDLSGRTHHVSTGVCLLALAPNGDIKARRSFAETSDVEFFELAPEEISAYVASGEPADKAGSYGIQGKGRYLIRAIRGDFYTIMGLPIARLMRELSLLEKDQRLVSKALKGTISNEE